MILYADKKINGDRRDRVHRGMRGESQLPRAAINRT